ncbi:Major facilitator superfamily domain general substrate transporter [Penicillium waksmanii]|uniref:Major facilitator superfamily domain general substrate transporter n=1 Tax=Penicillium waksmanii TaxID=69791 RepID=UPI002548C367|nr:Major facilitator superfamily domain general substrate transporter [Penicillium waksmanii]KAJ5980493.1 Major facilitator superfamily domain general substrate transporter [Penicillium waksmanii]
MADGSDLENSNKTELDRGQPSSNSAGDGSKDQKKKIPDDIPPEYATGVRLMLIMFTIFVSTILVSLEIGIIATAIPGITNDFRKLDDVGWYGSATFILAASASPLWGKLFKYLDVKWVYLSAVGIFLVGSIVAAAAPNSVSVIIGRAIQGWGASGVLGGTLIVINYVAPPRNHPLLIGTWMAVFMVSTILGPVIGGAFTSGVTWRWCFWINLPVGGSIIVLTLLFLRIPKHIKKIPATWQEIILALDLPGFCLLLMSLVCLTLALQWGGQTKSWNDGSVITTLVMWIVLSIGFLVTEWFQGHRAMAPFSILKLRMTWSNALFCLISYGALYQVMFYLPIYFQSIHGQSAVTSGVNTLPFLAFFALGAVVSGGVIGKTRYTQPYELLGALIMTAGMALIYILDVGSSKAMYIGAEVLFGFGVGICNQIPMTAVQGFSKLEDVSSATGIMVMCQTLSGAYFVAIGQSLFANRMLQTVLYGAAHLDPTLVLGTGASELQDVFSGDDLKEVIAAYMVGIKDVFAFSLACAAFAVLLSLIIPFKRLPDHGKEDKPATEEAIVEEEKKMEEIVDGKKDRS